jgi:hypothetical protein
LVSGDEGFRSAQIFSFGAGQGPRLAHQGSQSHFIGQEITQRCLFRSRSERTVFFAAAPSSVRLVGARSDLDTRDILLLLLGSHIDSAIARVHRIPQ